nr:uncharacterized protein LOC109181891 [Ipomoea trifida]
MARLSLWRRYSSLSRMELDLTLVLSSSRIGKSVRGDEWAEDLEYELEAAIDGGWKVFNLTKMGRVARNGFGALGEFNCNRTNSINALKKFEFKSYFQLSIKPFFTHRLASSPFDYTSYLSNRSNDSNPHLKVYRHISPPSSIRLGAFSDGEANLKWIPNRERSVNWAEQGITGSLEPCYINSHFLCPFSSTRSEEHKREGRNDDASSASTSAADAANAPILTAIITSFTSVPSQLALPHQSHPQDSSSTLIGWFSGRRRTPLRPSLHDSTATLSLNSSTSLSFTPQNSPHSVSLPPSLFLLLTTSFQDQLIHTHEYKAFQFRISTSSFEPKSLDIINISPYFRSHR